MARPRKAELVRQLGPLGGASSRLQLLERAGLTPESKADIVRSFVEQARAALTSAMSPLAPDQPDWHARMAAGARLLALVEALPGKAAGDAQRGPAVVIVNEVPAWAREPKAAQATVIDVSPQPRQLDRAPSESE